jgi:hypothetical protein
MLLAISAQYVLMHLELLPTPCHSFWIPLERVGPAQRRCGTPVPQLLPYLSSSRWRQYGILPYTHFVSFQLRQKPSGGDMQRHQSVPQVFGPQELKNQRVPATIGGAGGTESTGMGKNMVAVKNHHTWKADDVYRDLMTLERAITLQDAYGKLEFIEREEQLNFMAHHGQPPLSPLINKYLLFPLALAWPLSMLSRQGQSRIGNIFASKFVRLWDVHFWTFVVGAPTVVWMWKCLRKPLHEIKPAPEALYGTSPRLLEGLVNTDEFEGAEGRCDDYVLFLLEYWKSAVTGIAVLPLCGLFNWAVGKDIFLRQSTVLSLWWPCTQLLTRMAAVASLFQYREQMYRLQRSSQPRPVGFFPIMMQVLVRCMLSVIPLGMASDFSRVLASLPEMCVYPLYASIAIALLGTWTRMENLRNQDPPLTSVLLPRPTLLTKLAYGLCLTVIWRKELSLLATRAVSLLGQEVVAQTALYEGRRKFFSIRFILFFRILLWCLPAIRPLIHLCAVAKIVQIAYISDLPLTMVQEEYSNQALEIDDEMQRRKKWRLRVEWRKNRRLSRTVKSLVDSFAYWLIGEGQVEDVNRRKIQESMPPPTSPLIDRIQADIRNGRERQSRDKWKSVAMTHMARIHQADYERNGAVSADDPLGVAVQQTFGIGLGFRFDHTSPLKEGQQPSLRRLQARAAKSAIRRVQELYDAQRQNEEESDRPDDGLDGEAKLERRREEIEEEKKLLARRLTDLIPVGRSRVDAGFETLTNGLTSRTFYRKGSNPNEIIIERDPSDPTFGSFFGAVPTKIAQKSKPNMDTNDPFQFIDLLADTRVGTMPLPQQAAIIRAGDNPNPLSEDLLQASKNQSPSLDAEPFATPSGWSMIDDKKLDAAKGQACPNAW